MKRPEQLQVNPESDHAAISPSAFLPARPAPKHHESSHATIRPKVDDESETIYHPFFAALTAA